MVNGYDEAIMLTEAGQRLRGQRREHLHHQEPHADHAAASRDGVLEGITRATLMEIAQAELGVPTMERTIQRTELYTADEVFLCGTGAQVSPVTSIDKRPVGSGEVGPLTQALQQAYFDVVRGDSRAYAAWLQPVYEQACRATDAPLPAATGAGRRARDRRLEQARMDEPASDTSAPPRRRDRGRARRHRLVLRAAARRGRR